MKCSNFFKLYNDIQQRETAELIAAVNAHGGKYRFATQDAPRIFACSEDDEDYSMYLVTRLEVVEDGVLQVYGMNVNSYLIRQENEVELDFFVPGQLYSIIEAIPEAEQVQDVTLLPTPTEIEEMYHEVCDLEWEVLKRNLIANHGGRFDFPPTLRVVITADSGYLRFIQYVVTTVEVEYGRVQILGVPVEFEGIESPQIISDILRGDIARIAENIAACHCYY